MAALEFCHVGKAFDAVIALHDVSVAIAAGEAHAIVGENGAGKSTLLKILAGELHPDSGELRLDGQRLVLATPRDALARGIGLVHQEMHLFPDLSVTANIFAGRELTGRLGLLRESAMRDRTRDLLARLHLPASPDMPVGRLPIACRQLVQVARALAHDCRILALDEPTTSLTAAESDHLFRIIDDLQRDGVTIIYVSHRLPEVFRLADRVTVLRDGRHVATIPREETTPDAIVQAMIGRTIPQRAARSTAASDASLMRVDALTSRPCFEDVSFSIAAGEIVGIFGLVGAGRTEVLETIVGLRRPSGGTIAVGGQSCRFTSPREAAAAGVVLVPEERQRQGLFFNLSIRHNLVLPGAETRGTHLIRASERTTCAALMRRWRIGAPSIDAAPDVLSGGNQQKVVAAKWLALNPRVLLLDEPTKGVDIGAKYDIHGIIREMAGAGGACLVVSSDLPELLTLTDRILVMREGRVRGVIATDGADEERVMRLAAVSGGATA